MQLCESIESGSVDGDPNANTKKKKEKSILLPEDRWYCERDGNARLSDPFLKIYAHLKRRSVQYLWSTLRPLGPGAGC